MKNSILIYKQHISLFLVVMLSAVTAFGQEDRSPVAENATLQLVSDEFEFTEGPTVDKSGNVYFTDQPNNRIMIWEEASNSVRVFMQPAGRSNGLYFDKKGNLFACADEKFELWKIDRQKKVTVILDSYQDKKLNGPNDLWIDSNGGIYFTDPYYQRPWWNRSDAEQEKMGVYYLSPEGKELQRVDDSFVKPNGIIGSAKKRLLYVADRGANKTYSYTIAKDGSLIDKKLFVERDSDGMTLDEEGNVYFTGKDGVVVYNDLGEKIGHIPIDQKWTANVTFGGKDRKTLFITAMNSVYTLKMRVKGQ